MNSQQIIILLFWPGLGLLLMIAGVRGFFKSKTAVSFIASVAGLLLLLTFATHFWAFSQIFDPDEPEVDSASAKAIFEGLSGFPANSSVSQIRYRLEGFMDHRLLMTFQCPDKNLVEKIINKQDLNLQENNSGTSMIPDVPWWITPEGPDCDFYATSSTSIWKSLWHDKKSGVVFYSESSN